MASVFEERGTPYAAIDLDWRGWFDVGWDDDRAEFAVMLDNLRTVADNFTKAGARRFVLCQSIEHPWELSGVRSAIRMPLQVAQIVTDIDTIRHRCSSDPTSARAVDLEWAQRWLDLGTGTGFEDFNVTNDRPVRTVALEVMSRLAW
jgi:hypothetical protein